MDKKTFEQVQYVKSVGAFDEDYYLSQFDGNSAPNGDLIEHYFVSGYSDGKNPNIWFDTEFYLYHYSDVRNAGINPFYHYLNRINKEKRQPNSSFLPAVINILFEIEDIATKIEILNKHQHLLSHECINKKDAMMIESNEMTEFLKLSGFNDDAQELFVHPYFNAQWYSRVYGVSADYAWLHFISLGESMFLAPCEELVSVIKKIKDNFEANWFKAFIKLPHRFDFLSYEALSDIQKCYEVYVSGLFDSAWYANQYSSNESSLNYFSLVGIFEDHSPNEYFNSRWYRQEYRLNLEQLPLVHYIRSWRSLSFNPSSNFVLKPYIDLNPDLIKSNVEPLSHYLANEHEVGSVIEVSTIEERTLLLSTTCLFMSEWYENLNTDLQSADTSGLEHYILYGEQEGRKPNPFFDPIWYKETYLVAAEESSLYHYLTIGCLKEYDPSPDFSTQVYISEFSLQDIQVSALEHYLTIGRNQGWEPSFHTTQSSLSKSVEPSTDARLESFQSQLSKFGFRYSIDFNSEGVITGWIYNESDSVETVAFEVFINGNLVQEVPASLHRSDLSILNIENLNHGFYINANEWSESSVYTFSIYEKNTKEPLILNQSVFTLIDKIEAFLKLQSYLRKKSFAEEGSPLAKEVLETLVPSVISSLRDGRLELPSTNVAAPETLSSMQEHDVTENYIVSVVIPVYKGIEETENCILSVLNAENKTPYRLTVINDKSPETEMYHKLQSLVDEYGFQLLTNEENLGFVKTVNRGMRSSSEDIILLNSDTVVSDGWLDAIYFEAYEAESSHSVGTVTPMSNNATICSFPRFCVDNELPRNFNLETLARTCKSNMFEAVDLPTAHGYCMFIKRKVINAVGFFDEQKWGMGYAEENDFSLRASNLGWRHVMTNKTFVHHLGSVSFAEDSEAFIEKNLQKLNGIYPDYPVRVRRFVQEDPVRFLRNELSEKLLIEESKRYTESLDRSILFISLTIGGGTQKAVDDLSDLLSKESQNTYMLTASKGTRWTLSSMVSNIEATYHINNQDEYQGLMNLLKDLGVWHIHYHHVLEFSKRVWDIPSELNCEYDVTLHDFYMICPRVNMLTVGNVFCHQPANIVCNSDCLPQLGVHSSSYLNMSDFDNDVSSWQDFYEEKLNGARKVFTPSKDTKKRILQKIPVKNIVAQYHPEPVDTVQFLPRNLDSDGVLRIGFIGAIGPHKGVNKIKELVSYIEESGLSIEVVIFGYTSDNAFFENFEFVTITGAYKLTELETLLSNYSVHVMFLSSIWPETFGYTYSEVVRLGLPIVTFDIGAIPERAEKNKNVLILDASVEVSAVVAEIVSFVERLQPNSIEVGNVYNSLLEDYYDIKSK